MRNVGKKVNIMKYTLIEEMIVKEKIRVITHYPDEKIVRVEIDSFNNQDVIVSSKVADFIESDYDLIMSDNILFDEGKQDGSFRDIDVWKMIDKNDM